MRQIVLREFQTSAPIELALGERDQLAQLVPSLTICPVAGSRDLYTLKPDSTIGAVYLDNATFVIRPKLAIERVMFLISYALDPAAWQKTPFDFAAAESLVEAIVPAFIYHLENAFRRGLLQGYRYEEDSLSTVRGRIRIADQVRRRFGLAPPVEVAFDDFTEDIAENRLLKAALGRLRRMRLRSSKSRQQLHRFEFALQMVTDVEYRKHELPSFQFSRLNRHYRPALELAKLILRNSSFELNHGAATGTAFLVDMNDVFETFVAIALRESLRLTPRSWPRNGKGCNLSLDECGKIRLAPDLSWWDDGRCVFVGDVKYKRVNAKGITHPDLYQLLAYTIATDLPRGLLVYAKGEDTPREHVISHVGKRLEVVSVNLDGPPEEVLAEIAVIAAKIRHQRFQAMEI